MAILVHGMPCRMCNKPMFDGQRVRMFSPFVVNEADPLFKFDDAAFHEECFRRDPLSDAAHRRYQEVLYHRDDRACGVCAKKVTNPDEFFALGHLTDDTSSPLHSMNFLVFHLACLPQWQELDVACTIASKQIGVGVWRGKGMQFLVDTLTAARNSNRS